MIRYNVFPDAWPQPPLSKVVQFLDSQRKPVTASERIPGPYPYYGANGQQDSVNDYIFDEPLVLLAEDGGHFGIPGRKIAYSVSGKCWVNNHAHVLRPKKNIDLRYLTRVLENYDVTPFITGTTRAKLTKSAASRIPIPLPPLAEQRRIAAILDLADALRAKRRAALAKLDTLLQATFLDMFGDPVSNPRGWERGTLADVCSEIYRYPTFYGLEYIDSGTPVARIGNILPNGILDPDLNSYVFIDQKVSNKYPRTILEFQDIVMAVRGDGSTASRIGLVNSINLVGANISPNLLRFKANRSIVDPLYLYHLMTSERGQLLLQAHVTRTAKKTITARDIKKISIPIPLLNIQCKFVKAVNSIHKMRQNQKKYSREADNLFHALQQRAFKGEL